MRYFDTLEIGGKRYVRACRMDDPPKGRGLALELDDTHDIAVFCIDGTWYAVSNICPHQRLHVLCNGLLRDHSVQCPMHGWRFDLQTGQNMQNGASLRRYDLVEQDGWIWVEWPDEELPTWAQAL